MGPMSVGDRVSRRSCCARHEKATGAMFERLNAGTAELRQHTRDRSEDHRGFVAEARARRAAPFPSLDRRDPGSAGAGA